MATKYWVGGSGIWSATNTANWRLVSGSASFSGARASGVTTVTFTGLVGTIVAGDIILLNGVNKGAVAAIPNVVFTNSPTNTAGYFSSTTSTVILSSGLTTSAGTASAVPTTGDAIIFNQYSMYSNNVVDYDSSYGPALASLNFTGMRGTIYTTGASSVSLVPSVSGLITFPVAASGVYPNAFYILLTNTTTINNNGTTTFTLNSMSSSIIYYVNGLTNLPTNIIANALDIQDSATTLSLGSATYILFEFYSLLRPASMNAGTSNIIAASFSGNNATYNNVTIDLNIGAFISNAAVGYVYDSNIYNVLSIINGNMLPASTNGYVYFDNASTQTANKFNLLVSTDNSLSMTAYSTTATLTQTNSKPVYIQGTLPSSTLANFAGIWGMTFNPANTFFSVGDDYSNSSPPNVRLRPSPSPLNFV